MFALMTSVMNIGQILISPKVLGATLPKFGIAISLLILSLFVILAVYFISLILKELDKQQAVQATQSSDKQEVLAA